MATVRFHVCDFCPESSAGEWHFQPQNASNLCFTFFLGRDGWRDREEGCSEGYTVEKSTLIQTLWFQSSHMTSMASHSQGFRFVIVSKSPPVCPTWRPSTARTPARALPAPRRGIPRRAPRLRHLRSPANSCPRRSRCTWRDTCQDLPRHVPIRQGFAALGCS